MTLSALPIFTLLTGVSVLGLPIVIELVGSIGQFASSDSSDGFVHIYLSPARLWLLVRSGMIAGGIGLIGMCMGVPLARLIVSQAGGNGCFRSRLTSRVLIGVLLSPIWLPATLVYAAGNLLRAPDTIIGHALVSFSTSSDSLRWVTIWAGYLIAVLGLALWSAPIAGVLIASGLGFQSNLYDEMIALEPVGIVRRTRLWIRIHIAVLVRAWVLISILMLGSATAMHLAQLDTWSIIIWRQLAERSPEQWGSVWLSAWPMVIVAGIGAWMLTSTLIRSNDSPIGTSRGHAASIAPKSILVLAFLVWCLGALVPMISMLVTIDDLRSIPEFWNLQADAILDSGILAMFTGLATLGIAVLVAFTLGHPSRSIRKLGAVSVFTLIVLGLLPGVLIGAAIARSQLPFIAGSTWNGALLASVIRSGFLGAIIGALCALAESPDRQAVRWQIAGSSMVGWCKAVLPSIITPILGSALIGSLYALYEIEASVMVRPPGMDNLPQQLLSDLHYARLEQLSAAGINLLGIGLIVAIIASILLSRLSSARD